MNELIQFLFGYGFVASLYVAAFGAALVWMLLGMAAPKVLVWPAVLILASFPSSSLLIGEGGLGFDIYGKGAGHLLFSLYEIGIMLAALCVPLRAAYGRGWSGSASNVLWQPSSLVRVHNTLSIYYWLMAAIVLGYVVLSLLEPRGSWLAQLGRPGVIYLLLQGMFVATLLEAIDSQPALHRLMIAVGVAIALRMLWGGFRYVALGGDPASSYENAGTTLKITFWDINDSILAVLLASALTWLAATEPRWNSTARLLAFGFAVFCLGVVALSARRTAQGGALLALLVLWWLLPRGRKWWVVLLFALALPLAAYKLQSRSGDDGRTWFQRIVNAEQKGAFMLDPRYQRFHELRVAMDTIAENPLFGVGPAGAFDPLSHVGLEYHKGNYHFVHSGFVHVLLKTGVVGLLIFCGLLAAYLRAWRRQWLEAPQTYRTLLVASACSFAAGLPNLAFGTPLIELRTMLVMGLGFALPLLVGRLAQAERQSPLVARNGTPAGRKVFAGWAR